VDLKRLEKDGLDAIRKPFDAEHTRLFTFALPLEHEFVALRAVVPGQGNQHQAPADREGRHVARGRGRGRQEGLHDGKSCTATVYDRAKLKAGNRLAGPAIVMEMTRRP